MKTGFKTKLIALLLAIAMLAELSPVSAVDLTEEPAPQPSEETEGQWSWTVLCPERICLRFHGYFRKSLKFIRK